MYYVLDHTVLQSIWILSMKSFVPISLFQSHLFITGKRLINCLRVWTLSTKTFWEAARIASKTWVLSITPTEKSSLRSTSNPDSIRQFWDYPPKQLAWRQFIREAQTTVLLLIAPYLAIWGQRTMNPFTQSRKRRTKSLINSASLSGGSKKDLCPLLNMLNTNNE